MISMKNDFDDVSTEKITRKKKKVKVKRWIILLAMSDIFSNVYVEKVHQNIHE